MKRVGLMFAGQGAQAVGMGRDLYDGSAAARGVFDAADRILGRSITALCFEGPAEALKASANCQPAIYTMSMACLAALRERLPVEPLICGGLSLGEFAAITCAGSLDLEAGLRLVAERGRLMDEACRATDGAMAAVLGADTALVEDLCRQHGVDVANYNCTGQVVISGAATALTRAVEALGTAGVSRVMRLEVAGAFHSRLMAPAAAAFAGVLEAVPLQAPRCAVVQNVSGGQVSDPAALRRNLCEQVAGSVRWESCLRAMLAAGVEVMVELGPGKVLSGFLRRLDRSFPVCSVGSLGDLEAAVALLDGR